MLHSDFSARLLGPHFLAAIFLPFLGTPSRWMQTSFETLADLTDSFAASQYSSVISTWPNRLLSGKIRDVRTAVPRLVGCKESEDKASPDPTSLHTDGFQHPVPESCLSMGL